MSKTPDDADVARAFAKGLGIEGCQVTAALDSGPPKFAEGEWVITGPTMSGAYMLSANHKQIAIVTPGDCGPQQTAAHARLMARSVVRCAMLAHVLAELEGDDEGTRHGELIAMLQAELRFIAP